MDFNPSRRVLLGAGLAAAASPRCAFADEARIAPSALLDDARILQHAYAALHPGLLRYNTADEMEGRFAALRAYLAQPRTLAECTLALSRLTASVRCGHSFLNPTNQTGAPLTLMSGGRTRFPFHMRWIDGRMIVSDGVAVTPALAPGTEVLAIGGTPCGQHLRALMAVAHADGHNDAARVRQMELRGDDEWAAFDIFMPLLRPDLFTSGSVTLRVREPGAAHERALDVAFLSGKERASLMKGGAQAHGPADPIWHVERLATGVAWLAMPSWAVFDSSWDWQGALNAAMDEQASDKVRALVVDLRGNAGGLDVGDVILAHVVEREVVKADMRRRVRYRRVPRELEPYLTTWDRSFRDWGDLATGPDAGGFYTLARPRNDTETNMIRPAGRRFTGRLIVLVDASNSSATFGFAQTVKAHGLGTLVGQSTGGSRRGINGGAFFFLRLPNTGLEIDVPLIGYFPGEPQPDLGIEPDVPVVVSQSDLADRIDGERRAALRLASAR